MKDLVEDESAEEEWDDLAASQIQMNSSSMGSGFYVSDTGTLRQLHPSVPHTVQLFSYYANNIDPIFKILHIPSLQKLVIDATKDLDHISDGDSSVALLFAVYYAAITSLTENVCLTVFENAQATLLAQYRTGVERALSNADFLRKCDLLNLQALTIFMVTLHANDSTQLPWTLLALAVRLAHGLGLHRESSANAFPVLEAELRRRLWWQLIVLDGRFATDITTDRMISQASFNTKKPLNINDSDMNEATKTIVEREGLTEMTKCRMTHRTFEIAWSIQADCLPKQDPNPLGLTEDKKLLALEELERHITETLSSFSDPSEPLAWATSIIGEITIRRSRLVVYYPLTDDNYKHPPKVSRDHLLTTAVECMEYCHLLDTDPITIRWKWFSKNAPIYWYALAATLAALCVQIEGPLVDRAWGMVDLVYEDWSARLAKSADFKAWRPISKLRRKAQSQRTKALQGNNDTSGNGQAYHAPSRSEAESFSDIFENHPVTDSQAAVSSPHQGNPPFSQTSDSGTLDLLMAPDKFDADNFDADYPSNGMDWADWDQFARDIRMED